MGVMKADICQMIRRDCLQFMLDWNLKRNGNRQMGLNVESLELSTDVLVLFKSDAIAWEYEFSSRGAVLA